VGVNLGTSYLLNCRGCESAVGLSLNLLNAGYVFKSNFGVNLKWMGAGHAVSTDRQVGYGAILIGPMYSVPVGDRTYLDLKLASGLFWIVEKGAPFTSVTSPDDPLLADKGGRQSWMRLSLTNFAAGVALRHHFAKRWAFLFLTEYNSGKSSDVSFFISGKHLQAISVNMGVAFRI